MLKLQSTRLCCTPRYINFPPRRASAQQDYHRNNQTQQCQGRDDELKNVCDSRDRHKAGVEFFVSMIGHLNKVIYPDDGNNFVGELTAHSEN